MSDVVARYLNLSGAEITVTTDAYPDRFSHWTCAGCRTSETGGLIYLDKATSQANQHSTTCHALPPQ